MESLSTFMISADLSLWFAVSCANLPIMSETITFDAATTKRVEALYLTPDVVAQRAEILNSLALRMGERVLDVGVGPGLLAYDMAATVGPDGALLGVDPSASMLEMSRRRCQDLPQAKFAEGDACALPAPDASIDVAVSTQVYEYVQDLETAFRELHRVLAVGGRLAIVDTDYDSLVLASDNTEITERVIDAWDDHFVHRDLPRRLPSLLRAAGFEVTSVSVIPMLNTEFNPYTYGYGMVQMMGRFAAGRRGLTEADTSAWLEEMARLGREGRFFYSLNRYLVSARRPS